MTDLKFIGFEGKSALFRKATIIESLKERMKLFMGFPIDKNNLVLLNVPDFWREVKVRRKNG